MLKYLLDTNIAIYTIKEKPKSVRDTFRDHEGQLSISTITLMELVYGAEKSRHPEHNLRVVEGFIARLDVLDYDAEAALHTGQIRSELARNGTSIGPYDQMIAGHARSRGLVLVTHDLNEFTRIEGLRLEDWT